MVYYEETNVSPFAYTFPLMGILAAAASILFVFFLPIEKNIEIGGKTTTGTIYQKNPGVGILFGISGVSCCLIVGLAGLLQNKKMKVTETEIMVTRSLGPFFSFPTFRLPIAPIQDLFVTSFDNVEKELAQIGRPKGPITTGSTNGQLTRLTGRNIPLQLYRNLQETEGAMFVFEDGTRAFLGSKYPDNFVSGVKEALDAITVSVPDTGTA